MGEGVDGIGGGSIKVRDDEPQDRERNYERAME